MSRGYPDHGVSEAFGESFTLSDIAEVATRLGSIVTYDRRGLVVDLDSFETPVLKWEPSRENVLCTAILDSTSVRSLAQAVKLHTRAAAASYIMLYRYLAVPSHRRLGIEASFGNLTNDCYFDIAITIDYAGVARHGRVRANAQTGNIEVESPVGVYVSVGNMGIMYAGNFGFNTMKLVVDFATLQYVRLIGNMEQFDLSAYALPVDLAFGSSHISPRFRLINKAAVGGDVWVDDVILTKDEP